MRLGFSYRSCFLQSFSFNKTFKELICASEGRSSSCGAKRTDCCQEEGWTSWFSLQGREAPLSEPSRGAVTQRFLHLSRGSNIKLFCRLYGETDLCLTVSSSFGNLNFLLSIFLHVRLPPWLKQSLHRQATSNTPSYKEKLIP